MKAVIVGGGFGLYGYLPALVDGFGMDIILPSRYRPRILERGDISHYDQRIIWVEDEGRLLDNAEMAVIALPPFLQKDWVKKCLCTRNIEYILLEKPLAESPSEAETLLQLLQQSGRHYRAGYNFRYTRWGQMLLEKKSHTPRSIEWHFRAHHHRHDIVTWKKNHEKGGGPLRFYGIHIIALLAELGYQHVLQSNVDRNKWQAVIAGLDKKTCEIYLDTDSEKTEFRVIGDDSILYESTNPFGETKPVIHSDHRVPILKALIRDLMKKKESYDLCEATNRLWKAAEKPLAV